jgi:hypothetical protein
MERYGDGVHIRTSQDPSHHDKYQVELEAEIPGDMELPKAALESLGYGLADFDQWGLTYLSQEDPDLIADVDEINEYGDNTRLTLRKGRLSKYDVDEARKSLEQIYCSIIDEIGVPLGLTLLETPRSVLNSLFSNETEF